MNLPNKLTILRVILVPVFLAFLYAASLPHRYFYALAVFIIAALTDMADGKIARARHLITNFGKFLDPLADKLLVTAALICLIPAAIPPSTACARSRLPRARSSPPIFSARSRPLPRWWPSA